MKTPLKSIRRRGFTLLETVIAIGVLAVLLTGFMIVFAPAAAGIKRAINVQEADRLASTVEQELVTLRKGQESALESTSSTTYTGFDKAFSWIMRSNNVDKSLLVYQYRGSLTTNRADGSPEPVANVSNKLVGKDYAVRTMLRRRGDAEFVNDLKAIEGGVYLVKCTQLVFDTANGQLKVGTPGQIIDPKGTAPAANAEAYPEAVIAFAADFYTLPAKSQSFFDSPNGFNKAFAKSQNPVFTRNLAVRR